jgi:hypothetical protein
MYVTKLDRRAAIILEIYFEHPGLPATLFVCVLSNVGNHVW